MDAVTSRRMRFAGLKVEAKKEHRKLNFRFYDLVAWPCVFIFGLICKFEVKGERNLPKEGGFTVASNHIIGLDPPCLIVLMKLLRGVRVAYGGKIELFRIPLLGGFLNLTHQVQIDRQRVQEDFIYAKSLIREAEVRIANGMVFGLFPEGTRPRSGGMLPFQRGIAAIAVGTGQPIVPIGIAYSRAWYGRQVMHVTIGTPIAVAGRSSRAVNKELEEAVAELRKVSLAAAAKRR